MRQRGMRNCSGWRPMAESPLPCPRAGKWIGGCRFEAHHEYGRPAKWDFGWGVRADEAERLLRASRRWIYVRDVCRTCGRTIERLPPPPAHSRYLIHNSAPTNPRDSRALPPTCSCSPRKCLAHWKRMKGLGRVGIEMRVGGGRMVLRVRWMKRGPRRRIGGRARRGVRDGRESSIE